ncbi:putative transposase [Escherichia coli 2-427-07_S4_C2]|nr:putative transposase [Escherichia coli BCE008_MS-13]KDY40948.1 putative transposase [Escherichia coli 2-427-07_S4_C2]KEO42516.1 putative transposase [Escherichia coli 2-460-02_S1_C2]
MPAFEWVHVQLHQQKGMISLSPPTICNSAVVITSAFSDKFLVCFIKVKISCQLKLIRFTGESAIAFSLLSGQKVNGHIGLPA